MNNSLLIGRIANDLELRGTTENKVVNFNLAVERYGKKDEVDFIPCTVFGKSAENLVQYQAKGSLIAIQGYIRQENYQTEAGEKRNSFKVIASRVQYLGTKGTKQDETVTFSKDNEFTPSGLDSQGFQAIEDDDIPF